MLEANGVQQYNDGWPHDVFGPSLCRSIVPAPQRILPASCLPDCQGFVLTSPLLLLTSSSSSSLLQLQLHIRRARQCELRIDPGSVISAAWDLTSCRSAIRRISANGRRRGLPTTTSKFLFPLLTDKCIETRQMFKPCRSVGSAQACAFVSLTKVVGRQNPKLLVTYYATTICRLQLQHKGLQWVRHGHRDDSCYTSSFHDPSFS